MSILPAFGIFPPALGIPFLKVKMDLFTHLTESLTRADLTPAPTLTREFLQIRRILAGEAEGMTLDQTLVDQVIDLLICKLYDESRTAPDAEIAFQWKPGEEAIDVARRIQALFDDIHDVPDIGELFEENDAISLDANLLGQVVQVLQRYELSGGGRDVVGEAFEEFMGTALRGDKGQFFTPRNVVDLACYMLQPRPGETVLDPACGTGGFLTQALRIGAEGEAEAEPKALGIDKDCFLARVAAVQLAIMRKNKGSWAYCANSLRRPDTWPPPVPQRINFGVADVIMTNPPFGAKIPVRGDTLEDFSLGHKWKKQKGEGHRWTQTDTMPKSRPPQVLFIERCLDLMRPGGRMGIVLPDSILGNVGEAYVRQFILSQAEVFAIVDLPLETFMPSTSTKTSLLFLRKRSEDKPPLVEIFMARPERCGHDRRGKPLVDEDGEIQDDFPQVAAEFEEWRENYGLEF